MPNSGDIRGYRSSKASTGNLSAADTYVAALSLVADYNFSVSGTWVGTITLQRSFDNGTTWLDVATTTANVESIRFEPEVGVLYRAGFKAAQYTSGTAAVRLSQ